MKQLSLKSVVASAIAAGTFTNTTEGAVFEHGGISVKGEYFDRVNGGEWQQSLNLVVNEGLAHILNVALGTKAKAANYYLALFSGATAPTPSWTAASFASVASEIVSNTEGYTNATRPVWTPAEASGNSIDNMVTAASLTIATSSTLTVTGAALLTAAAKGATTGVLVSATKYAAPRQFQNGDIYEVGYRLSLTV